MSKKPIWAVAAVLQRAGVPCAEEIAWMLGRHIHSYTAAVTEPTCTEEGSTIYICGGCGDTYTESVPALGHAHGEPVEENRVEATPEAAGSYDSVVYCTRCGEELSRETVAIPQLQLKGFLYNGVWLPDISEYVTAERPYAFWTMDGSGACSLCVTPIPIYCRRTTNAAGEEVQDYANTGDTAFFYTKCWGVGDGDTSFIKMYCKTNYSVKAQGLLAFPAYAISPALVFWSNYDMNLAEQSTVSGNVVYTATDTLFFPKSPDPVPVYK